MPTRRDEDGIDDEWTEQTGPLQFSDSLYGARLGQHAGLDDAHVEVLDDGTHLSFDVIDGNVMNCANAQSVLGGDGRDGARTVHTKGAEGAKIGLNPGAAARVRARNCQDGHGLHGFNLVALVSTMASVNDTFMVGSVETSSRLVMGTGGGFRSLDVLRETLLASEATIATVALRRVDHTVPGSIYDLLSELGIALLPNTAGCYSAPEAIKIAEMAREAFETNLVKLEIIGDEITLLPDTTETLNAAQELVRRGFEVWAYTSDDLIVAERLEQAGCVAVMPLGSPIGSGLGVRNPHAIALITERVQVPVLLDAGVGTASDAALAMELGCAGVLAASAINRALEPVLMAAAIRDAVRAGHQAFRAGRIPPRRYAEASSSAIGRPDLLTS